MTVRETLEVPLSRIIAMPPPWVRSYIGLKWAEHGRGRDGCDCWGLVRLVLFDRFGLDVPSYDGSYGDTADRAELAALIAGEMGPWRAVSEPDREAGDVALFRLAGQPCHVGLVVAENWMLHVQRGTEAALERFDGIRWSRRLEGAYRYVG